MLMARSREGGAVFKIYTRSRNQILDTGNDTQKKSYTLALRNPVKIFGA
jgi:hypothetical protein